MRPSRCLFLIIVAVTTLCSCATGDPNSRWNRPLGKRPPETWAIDNQKEQLWNRYVYDLLYIGMPEEEFVDMFSPPHKEDHPYIAERVDSPYVFIEFPRYDDPKDRARVTFWEGKLVRYERFGRGSNPWGYSDNTALLRPAKDAPAQWKSAP